MILTHNELWGDARKIPAPTRGMRGANAGDEKIYRRYLLLFVRPLFRKWSGPESRVPGHSAADGQKEKRAPKRHWRDWFAPYVDVM